MQSFKSFAELETAFKNYQDQTCTSWCIAKSLPAFSK